LSAMQTPTIPAPRTAISEWVICVECCINDDLLRGAQQFFCFRIE